MSNSPVTICGNIANDPQYATGASGKGRATFSVAVEHRFQKDGEWTSETGFFNVVAWGFVADDVAGKVEKGSRVIVVGRMNNRSYEGNDGTRQYMTEVVADRIGLDLGGIESAVRRSKASAGVSGNSSGSFQRPDLAAEDIW